MRERHMEFIERWATYVRTHPDWKNIHTQFINAQFAKHYAVLEQLRKTPEGREKIVKLYNIKNREGYKGLLGKG